MIRAVKLAWLVAGGALGTVSRFWLSRVIHDTTGPHFPYGTLAVNAVGCLFIGFLATMGQGKVNTAPEIRLFFMVGFCGAFTTFSSLILETDHLFKSGQMLHAFGNIFISLIAGFLTFALGSWLGSRV